MQGAGGEAEDAGGHADAANHTGARDSPRGAQGTINQPVEYAMR